MKIPVGQPSTHDLSRVNKLMQELAIMPVTRCVCHDVTFAELKQLGGVVGADLDALAARTGCGTGCGTCVPYIQLMLRTGKTEFPVLSGLQIREALRPGGSAGTTPSVRL